MHKSNGDISRDPVTFPTIANYRIGLLHRTSHDYWHINIIITFYYFCELMKHYLNCKLQSSYDTSREY